jgi:hypothetical protein
MAIPSAKETFLSPPNENRPVPFWFWNDHLDPSRLVWQYDRLLEAGMAGAVMHARSGLEAAEYLDDRWFDAIGAVTKHAHDKGGIVWIYDELGWPSGSAGGRALVGLPLEMQLGHLVLFDITVEAGKDYADLPGRCVGAFKVLRSDPDHGFQRRYDNSVNLMPDRIAYEELPSDVNPADHAGARLLLFQHVIDSKIVDYYNAAATEVFLKSTHEIYYEKFGQYFGKTLTHSFMDEAGSLSGVGVLPWSPIFESEFEKRRGYTIRPQLPALFFETPGHQAVRFDYWSLSAELFREGFGEPMDRWCNQHGIKYSGHYVCETSLKEAIRQLGSTMPLYEFEGLVGVDVLGNDFYTHRFETEAYAYYSAMVKQASSVANQLKDGQLLSESYGVGGHAMSLESMQAATMWQMALGVTVISQHAAFYSLRGKRKEDHPPTIGWQEPYWKFARKHIDSISRTSWLLSQGSRVCDVLFLHPQAGMHATYRQYRVRAEFKYENYVLNADMPYELIDKHFCLLTVALLDAQIDFEYGDEEIMAKHGAAEAGAIRVGKMRYRTVFVQPMLNIRSTTLALLQEFVAKGGKIVLAGSAPCLVDGRPSQQALDFFNAHAKRVTEGVDFFDYAPATAALSEFGCRTIETSSPTPQLKVHRRVWEGRDLLFLANISREATETTVTFTPCVTGHIEEWNVEDGTTRPIAACAAGVPVALPLSWHPKQARAFLTVPGVADIPAVISWKEETRIRPEWAGTRTGPNALLLDQCAVQDGSGATLALSVGDARKTILAGRIKAAATAQLFAARFPIHVSETNAPDTPCELAIEFGLRPRIALNTVSASLKVLGWAIDPASQRIALPALKSGDNTLLVEATYEDATEFESPWLMGDFAVTTEDNIAFTVEKAENTVPIGEWHTVGLPFYAGSVVYRTEIDMNIGDASRAVLDLSGLAGSAQVKVNEKTLDTVLWQPYTCDITCALKAGTNVIEIEVANTLRNLLGAHYVENEEIRTGAPTNRYTAPLGTPKKFWKYGLLTAPEIVISNRA